MEQYENNSLNNCTDNNEFHSQQPADADFKQRRHPLCGQCRSGGTNNVFQ